MSSRPRDHGLGAFAKQWTWESSHHVGVCIKGYMVAWTRYAPSQYSVRCSRLAHVGFMYFVSATLANGCSSSHLVLVVASAVLSRPFRSWLLGSSCVLGHVVLPHSGPASFSFSPFGLGYAAARPHCGYHSHVLSCRRLGPCGIVLSSAFSGLAIWSFPGCRSVVSSLWCRLLSSRLGSASSFRLGIRANRHIVGLGLMYCLRGLCLGFRIQWGFRATVLSSRSVGSDFERQ